MLFVLLNIPACLSASPKALLLSEVLWRVWLIDLGAVLEPSSLRRQQRAYSEPEGKLVSQGPTKTHRASGQCPAKTHRAAGEYSCTNTKTQTAVSTFFFTFLWLHFQPSFSIWMIAMWLLLQILAISCFTFLTLQLSKAANFLIMMT